MTYLDWLRKYPMPNNFIRDSAPVLAALPQDKITVKIRALHNRMKARGAT